MPDPSGPPGEAVEVGVAKNRMSCYRICACWAAVLSMAGGLACRMDAAAPVPTYNQDIRPILSDNCFACHGPDQSKRKAKLRLDIREEAIAKKAIVPNQPDDSELVRRIFLTDPDELMPPPKSNKKLTTTQKETLRQWIAGGAVYEGHWAYVPPHKASTPADKNAIDYLVQQRLQQIGMRPSPEADRRTLARRLFFDLVGVPPRPDQVEAFEKDSSPGAYERLVESLISSPAYGERMAIGWLDVVRYADTIGYHSDNPRNVWPYRDYVIRSFNHNKPFDQFTREQLAGDLLPNPTVEQKVGSAFNRLLLSTEEGGAQPKDYEARMLTDRVRAVAAVWLGQTLGCAQCHDHKFDPITSRDFYSMGAFFADIQEPIIGRREDGMPVPDDKQAAELARLDAALNRQRDEYELPRPDLLAHWEKAAQRALAAEPHWTVLSPEQAKAESGSKLSVAADGVISAEKDPSGGKDTYRVEINPGLLGIQGFRLDVLPADKLPAHGPGRSSDGGFVLSEFAVYDAAGNALEIADASATYEAAGNPARAAVDGSIEGSNGWAVRGLGGVPQTIYFALREPVDSDRDNPLTLVLTQGSGNHAVIGRFRLSATSEPAVLSAPGTTVPPPEIADLLALAPAQRTPDQEGKLKAYHRSIAPELADLRQNLAAAQRAKDQFETSVPHCLISVSAEKPRTVRILPRGNWMLETGDIVQPSLPAYLVSSAAAQHEKPLNRLDLGNWLVSRENPLTARVVMNRIWKQFFGMGLSRVLDDFGAQGEQPINQPLLDWLACEFMDSGWDLKHMVRLMVTSQTYRQVSTASKELQTRDPANRELARQSRWRLEAELVRDNALSVAGLLVSKVGGPSVKPYQPDGYWENLNFPVRTYEASTGEDQYRRGLYTWWQRSYLHPSLVAFDAPTREECAAERGRSNIPQQALVLLNDPTYVEAARVFAARILQEGGQDATARINWAWQQALSRAPRPDELQSIYDLLYRQVSQTRQNPALSETILKVGLAPVPPGIDHAELAAWTSVARVLLNLHETITRS